MANAKKVSFKLNGKPVEVETVVQVGFKLTKPKEKAPAKAPAHN